MLVSEKERREDGEGEGGVCRGVHRQGGWE